MLNVFFYLLEDLAGKHHHRGCAVADLGILGSSNVDEDSGSGVHDVEKLVVAVSIEVP